MQLTKLFMLSASLIQINFIIGLSGGQKDETTKLKLRKKDFFKLLQLADVPDFDVEFVYEETFSPDGIVNQLIQNFFNWFSSTMFWLSYTPFYNRLLPIFAPANNQRSLESVFNPMAYLKYLLMSVKPGGTFLINFYI